MKPTINISQGDEFAFQYACSNGHLSVVQWLLDIKPIINISLMNEFAFRYACGNGHLSIAQWLLNIKPTIDISAENEYAFRVACENGHLNVAQWLFEMKSIVNISVIDDAFRYSCVRGRLDIAQWLYKNNSTILIQDYNPYYYTFFTDQLLIAQWLLQKKPTSLNAARNISQTPTCRRIHLCDKDLDMRQLLGEMFILDHLNCKLFFCYSNIKANSLNYLTNNIVLKICLYLGSTKK
jgi:hypothetical protein